MARKTKEQAEATREQLIDAAERIFCECGVAGTTLDDIAKGAGVTRGAVYWHFKNKTDVLEAVCNRASSPMQSMLERLSNEPGDDPLGQLRENSVSVLQKLAGCCRTQAVFDLMFRRLDGDESAELRAREAENGRRCRTQLETVLRAAVAKGQLPGHFDPAAGALLLESTVCGLMYSWLESRDFDLAAQAPWLMATLFAGLGRVPPALENVA